MNLFGTSEQVTVTPQAGLDGDGDPIPGGTPVVIEAITVAPGNTAIQFMDSGDVDSADFTVYLPIGAQIKDDDLITVRERTCLARVQEWRDPWPGGVPLDGVVVLCKSVTGAS